MTMRTWFSMEKKSKENSGFLQKFRKKLVKLLDESGKTRFFLLLGSNGQAIKLKKILTYLPAVTRVAFSSFSFPAGGIFLEITLLKPAVFMSCCKSDDLSSCLLFFSVTPFMGSCAFFAIFHSSGKKWKFGYDSNLYSLFGLVLPNHGRNSLWKCA